ncbi:hypothetical protein PCASD_07855 [Puccinia coronata f. sp. avenae]|uniref:Uncharacterized protein n=1 Tax=Puccinia coronata f. sp. avenae TaxID=200324 RepID=A0A2N5UR58_9BASI|nr:hypothetical protein PCASD_07855 [Puccinia coronata f. sp. avenae]
MPGWAQYYKLQVAVPGSPPGMPPVASRSDAWAPKLQLGHQTIKYPTILSTIYLDVVRHLLSRSDIGLRRVSTLINLLFPCRRSSITFKFILGTRYRVPSMLVLSPGLRQA